jgi:DNA-binding CsgD family transcriptional regulator
MQPPRWPSFVGRDAELAVLERLLPSPAASGGAAVALIGEAGIGKTRLVDALAETGKRLAMCTVRAAAYEVEDPLPYAVFAEAFTQWVRDEPGLAMLGREPLLTPLGRLVPPLAMASGRAGQPADTLSAQDERFRLLEAAGDFLRAGAGDRPLLVVLEDMHWADRHSWSMLLHVVRSARGRAALFVLTARPGERGDEPEPFAALAREVDVRRIRLGALDLRGSMQMLEALAGERLPLAIAQLIHEESGGSPFYLRHVFEHLVEEGKLQRRAGRWSTDFGLDELGIPRGVRPLLSRRFGRLSDAAVAVLRIASIFPDRFELQRLRTLSDESDDRLLDLLDEGLEAGVLVKQGSGYTFAHALLRRALLDALNPDRRARLHRRAAEQLALADDDPGETARQYHASRGIPGAEAGFEHAVRAAGRAAAAHLYGHQAMFLRIAADLEGGGVRPELLRDLALAEAAALDTDAAVATARRVGGGHPFELDFLVALARRLKDAGAEADVWEPFVTQGLAACGERRDLMWARLQVLRPRWVCRWVGEVCEISKLPFDPVALEILHGLGDEDDIASTLDPYESRTREQTQQVQRWAETWTSAAAIIRARDTVARDWIYRHGDLSTAAQKLYDLAYDAERFGSLPGHAEAYAQLAHVEAWRGLRRASEQAIRAARTLAARLGPGHRVHAVLEVVNGIQVYFYGGDWSAVRQAIGQRLAVVARLQAPIGLTPLAFATIAEAFLADDAAYEERAEALLCSLERTDLAAYLANAALSLGVSAVWEQEDIKRALRFEKLVRKARERFLGAGPIGDTTHALSLARLAAVQGRAAEARELFAEARVVLEASGAVLVRALVDLDEARVAGTMGDGEAWRALVTQAARKFAELEMTPWSNRASAYEAAGPPPAAPNPHASGPDGLSPREVEILGMLAAGGNAKTIAVDLGLSVATVSRHLANVYAKIGVNSRVAATAYAHKNNIRRG